MAIRLEDSSTAIWLLGITTAGLLTTTVSTGVPQTLFLNNGGLSWQIGVNTGGLLTSTNVTSGNYPASVTLEDISGGLWALSVTFAGLLQTGPGMALPWVQNGFGAGTDNSIVGGGGGFLAYPQPIVIDGPINFQYNSSTPQGQGNIFSVFNPGRN